MKNLMIITAIAVSSVLTITACAHDNRPMNHKATTNSSTSDTRYHHMQQQEWMGMGHMGMNAMMSELDLTANQRTQIQALRRNHQGQNHQGNYQQHHAAMMQILTPAQQKKLTERHAQYRNNGHHMNNGGHMNRNGNMMNQDGHHMNRGHHMNQNHHMNQGNHMNNGGRYMNKDGHMNRNQSMPPTQSP